MHSRVVSVSIGLLVVLSLSACSGSSSVTASGTTTTPTIPLAVGGPAARAGTCPTQDQIDATQNAIEAAKGNASSVDELTSEYDASFDFLAAYLPEERQADLQAVRAAFEGYLQALSGVDLSNPDTMSSDQAAQLDQAGQAFDTPDVEAANGRIEDYFSQTCPDVDFGQDSTSGSTTATG